MPQPVAKRLATLPALSRAALADLWKQLFKADPSPKLRSDLMIPILAYRMQEQAFGTLNDRARERLRRLAPGFRSHHLKDATNSARNTSGAAVG